EVYREVYRVVATSSIEAEYVAAASGYAQVLWMQNQLLDYGDSPLLGVNTPRSDEDRLKLIELMVFLMKKGVCDEFGLNAARLSKFLLSGKYAAEGFEQIIDFLSGSYINHALTVNPHVYISCIKQFWNTAVKVFANIRRVGKGFSGVEIPLFESMLAVRDVAEEVEAQVHAQGLENDKAAQQLEIVKLKARVKKLEKINKVTSSKLRRLKKVGSSQRVESSDDVENVFNQGRIIVDMDQNEGIELVTDQEKDAEVEGRQQAEIYNIDLDHSLKVAAANPEEELPSDTPAETPKVKDKGKGILIEALKPIKKKDQIEMDAEYARKLQEEINKEHEESYKNIDWNTALDHVQSKEPQYIKRYHGMKKKPQTESEARKNMIFYLKNTEGYKMDFFKGKNINETHAQKAAKRRKLSEEAQKADDLRKRLEIVQDEDDDVFVEATPLAQKVPVVDYQIVVIDNKPKFKIIRADDTHQFYISFTTLLKNFNREDLKAL
nr:hypothetical protein [Tanacetum cinerariifolium]